MRCVRGRQEGGEGDTAAEPRQRPSSEAATDKRALARAREARTRERYHYDIILKQTHVGAVTCTCEPTSGVPSHYYHTFESIRGKRRI